ncbi:MAG: VWA domain-containing protein [Actinomycetota bacterium]
MRPRRALALLALATICSTVLTIAPSRDAEAAGTCGPMDVAIVLDSTTSMDSAIAAVKRDLAAFVDTVETASGGDYRLSLVTFHVGVDVRVPFRARNGGAIRGALAATGPDGGSDLPEAWDEALETVITSRPASEAEDQEGAVGKWRDGVTRLIVLMTDARPAGFDDDLDPDDLDHAMAMADLATEEDMRLSTFFVASSRREPEAEEVLREVARRGRGAHFRTSEDGSNLDQGLGLVVEACGADSDGDGLFDLWETEGYDADGDGTIDVDLAAMGADPEHMDVFVQVSWMQSDEAAPCYLFVFCPPPFDRSHEPDPEALERVVQAFEAAPVENEDGESGIRLHIDAGAFSPVTNAIPVELREGGPVAEHLDVLLQPGNDPFSEYFRIREASLSAARAPLFTFALYAHHLARNCLFESFLCDDNYGIAVDIPSDGFIVAERRIGSVGFEAALFMHELGHTLGLHHGGSDDVNGKPNYLSVMNYSFAFLEGLAREGGPPLLDYSRWELAPLDERGELDEPLGVQPLEGQILPPGFLTVRYCGSADDEQEPEPLDGPQDWNCEDGAEESGVRALVHRAFPEVSTYERLQTCSEVDSDRAQLLCSHEDWSALSFTGGVRGGLESELSPDAQLDEGLTPRNYFATSKPFAVDVEGGGEFSASPGSTNLVVPFLVRNAGETDDTYALSVSSDGNGDAPEAALLDTELEVPAGEEGLGAVRLSIPGDTDEEDAFRWVVSVQSRGSETTSASVVVAVQVTDEDPAAPEEGRLTVVGSPARPGDEMVLRGEGFADSAPVVASIAEGETILGAVQADASGSVRAAFVVPALSTGWHDVHLTGPGEGGEGALHLSGTLSVAEPRESAATGSSGPWVWIGFGLAALVAVGGAAVLWLRGRSRRRTRAVDVPPRPDREPPSA